MPNRGEAPLLPQYNLPSQSDEFKDGAADADTLAVFPTRIQALRCRAGHRLEPINRIEHRSIAGWGGAAGFRCAAYDEDIGVMKLVLLGPYDETVQNQTP